MLHPLKQLTRYLSLLPFSPSHRPTQSYPHPLRLSFLSPDLLTFWQPSRAPLLPLPTPCLVLLLHPCLSIRAAVAALIPEACLPHICHGSHTCLMQVFVDASNDHARFAPCLTASQLLCSMTDCGLQQHPRLNLIHKLCNEIRFTASYAKAGSVTASSSETTANNP